MYFDDKQAGFIFYVILCYVFCCCASVLVVCITTIFGEQRLP